MTIQTEKRVPGVPDRALDKIAQLANTQIEIESVGRISNVCVQLGQHRFTAENNTQLVAAVFAWVASHGKR